MIDHQIEITHEQREVFGRDGVVHIPNAVSEERVEQIRRIADGVLASPSRFAGDTFTDGDDTGPAATQAYATAEPGAYPADDDRFPLIWSR